MEWLVSRVSYGLQACVWQVGLTPTEWSPVSSPARSFTNLFNGKERKERNAAEPQPKRMED